MGAIGYAWRILVVTVVYLAATAMSGALVAAVELQFPEIPGQTFSPVLNLVAALFVGGALAALARHVGGSGAARWLILSLFMYVSFGVNNQIEAAVFTTIGGTAAMLVFWLIPCVAACGAAVALIQIREPATSLGTAFTGRPLKEWWWRAVLAWLAFPVVYYVFGMTVSPFVIEAYRQGQFSLTLPGHAAVLSAVSVRSLLFLLATVPILGRWAGSRRGLIVTLAGALFVMVGAVGMILGTWLPVALRIAHGIEILADSVVYAWLVVALLVRSQSVRGEVTRSPVAG